MTTKTETISADPKNPLTAKILDVHAFDGNETFDAKLIISTVKHIISLTKYSNEELQTQSDQDDMIENNAQKFGVIANRVNEIYFEIISKCSEGGGTSTTNSLLGLLSNYSWGAKAAIALAAFSINYGEFCLVEHLNTKYQLAKELADLMDFPLDTTDGNKTNNKLVKIFELLNLLVNVADGIIEIEELFKHDPLPELVTVKDNVPQAVYWIVSSILICAFALLDLFVSDTTTSMDEIWADLFPHRQWLEKFQSQLRACQDSIEEKKVQEAYIEVKESMDRNSNILKTLIRSKGDKKPLYNGSDNKPANLEDLKFKHVMLLISDLQFPPEMLNIFHKIYEQTDHKRAEYEVVWLPMVGKKMSTEEKLQFNRLKIQMPWYSLDHPSLVDQGVVRYIREVWKFEQTPKVVVLDKEEGKISNHDALPMLWVWGSKAFPFSTAWETVLWEEKTAWNFEFLADAIDPRIPEWIKDNKVICLYGGEDIKQICDFTNKTKSVAMELNVPIEMFYVGQLLEHKDSVRQLYQAIAEEKFCHMFPPEECYDYIWYFWERIWSMWCYKKNMGMQEDDEIMKKIKDMLSYKNSEIGWAVFSQGNNEMTQGNQMKLMSVLGQYEELKNKVDKANKFVKALDEMLNAIPYEHHCNKLILPANTGNTPELVVCADCGKIMERSVIFLCRDDLD